MNKVVGNGRAKQDEKEKPYIEDSVVLLPSLRQKKRPSISIEMKSRNPFQATGPQERSMISIIYANPK
jgi:hypothetical protein